MNDEKPRLYGESVLFPVVSWVCVIWWAVSLFVMIFSRIRFRQLKRVMGLRFDSDIGVDLRFSALLIRARTLPSLWISGHFPVKRQRFSKLRITGARMFSDLRKSLLQMMSRPRAFLSSTSDGKAAQTSAREKILWTAESCFSVLGRVEDLVDHHLSISPLSVLKGVWGKLDEKGGRHCEARLF